MTFATGVLFDDNLSDWSTLSSEPWSGLLLGNGASIAVWSKFNYSSLYDEALKTGLLTSDAVTLFNGFDTQNFEEVLSRLQTTISVKQLLGQNSSREEDLHSQVKIALITAVHGVHVQYSHLSEVVRDAIKNALLDYDFIYTTNYDLLAYWAIQRDQSRFDDLFRTRDHELVFASESELTDRKRVLYLHGALHLFRKQTGVTHKDSNDGADDLLTRFETKRNWSTTTPLFVSEGTAGDKLRAIRGSEYLSYVFKRFASHSGSLVIFGFSFSDSDGHLASRIKGWDKQRIAVSVRPTDLSIKDTKVKVRHALGWTHDLAFFDSTTHPLGASALRVG